jgi:predicted TIM-barrel fold metal-dependent hydrolase
MTMRTITLEEHFVTADFLKATHADGDNMPPALKSVRERLLDLGPLRIAAMDEASIDLQIISLAAIGVDALAPAEQTAILRSVNDEAAAAVDANPTRLAAFCTPGLKEPANAVKEIDRCITQLGFKGVYFDGLTDGKFLDAPEFFPILEAAAALKVPIYIHPAPPPASIMSVYFAGLDPQVAMPLSIAGWGWHAETGLHTLRLIVSGVLDRLPTLQVIIGHMGEGIPYALARSNGILSAARKSAPRTVTETFLEQVHVTTSGYFTKPPFDCCREVIGLNRMMYSVDYPFSPNTKGKDFLASLKLNEADLTQLTQTNAERVLNL